MIDQLDEQICHVEDGPGSIADVAEQEARLSHNHYEVTETGTNLGTFM